MPFTRGHKINIGRIWSKERNLKVGLALNRKVKIVCVVCGSKFMVSPYRRANAKYCSNSCKFRRGGPPHSSICNVCHKTYGIKPSRQKRYPTRFCSASCHGKYRISEQKEKFFRDRHGKNHPMWGKHLPEEWKKKISENHADLSGSKSPTWRGGITPINDRIRKTKEYKTWARMIKIRDDFTCQNCGLRGGRLESDHIKPFSAFTGERFSLENGQTLCRKCHLRKSSEDVKKLRKEYAYLWQT